MYLNAPFFKKKYHAYSAVPSVEVQYQSSDSCSAPLITASAALIFLMFAKIIIISPTDGSHHFPAVRPLPLAFGRSYVAQKPGALSFGLHSECLICSAVFFFPLKSLRASIRSVVVVPPPETAAVLHDRFVFEPVGATTRCLHPCITNTPDATCPSASSPFHSFTLAQYGKLLSLLL